VFLFACLQAVAPAPALPSRDPDEIVVIGRGLPALRSDAAFGAVTIGRDRLTGSASGRLEDVLRDVAGFQQFRRADSRAANPTTQGATLRALGGNAASRALVLLDGVPQADPFAGYIPYAALRPERLASARVTRGGGAGAFGVGAVAGTIELTSGGPDLLPPLSLRAFGGSRDATELSAGLAQAVGDGFVTLNAGWDRGDGYILVPRGQRGAADVPARYNAQSIAARLVQPLGSGLELQASGLAFDDRRLRGLAGTDSRTQGLDLSLRLVGRGAWGVDAVAYIQNRDFASGFVATPADRSTTTLTLDQFSTPATGLGAKIELRPPVGGGHRLRFGADVRRADGATNERFRFQNGVATRLRRAGGETLTYGTFIEDEWTEGALTLTGGARLDRWSISDGTLRESDIATGDETQSLVFADRSGVRPTARGSALLALGDDVDVRAAAYTGFRVPTLNELYRPFRVGADAVAANAALRLEKLRGMEAGIAWRPAPRARAEVTAFWNRLDDAIANVTVAQGPGTFPQVGFVAGTFRERRNVDAIRVRGIEASGSYAMRDWLLSASYAFTDARVRAGGAAAALNGKRPAQSPKHQGSATLAYAPAAGPAASATLRYAGAQFEDDLQSRRLPDALTIDATASLPLGRGVSLVARAENLLDEAVVSGISATGVRDLGTPRTVWLGLTFGG
jgi:outer membrane receptor protein involved in Fe transport